MGQEDRLALAAMLLFLLSGPARLGAEQFLTVPEALRVCFPEGESFEEKQFTLVRDQAKALTRQCKVKTYPGQYRYWEVRQGDRLVGVVMWDRVLGKHELIDYMVALHVTGSVQAVEIVEYREHYGGEIRHQPWLDQFQGKNVSDKLQLGDDIYNISGATLSCRNITRGVKRVLATFEEIVRPSLAPAAAVDAAAALPPGPPAGEGGHE